MIEHQERLPESYVYVFVSPCRYDYIQKRRQENWWTTENERCPVNNFKREFDRFLKGASIDEGKFHDLRRTCITRWFRHSMTEFDVMKLTGHSDFSTTHRFYLAVRPDLLEKARTASVAAISNDFGARPYRE